VEDHRQNTELIRVLAVLVLVLVLVLVDAGHVTDNETKLTSTFSMLCERATWRRRQKKVVRGMHLKEKEWSVVSMGLSISNFFLNLH
jgi:hypothetical protein